MNDNAQMKRVLAIIACGAGTRMQYFTGSNYIPKLLLNIGTESILSKIIKDNYNVFDTIAIALNCQEHIDMCKQHLKENFANVNVDNIVWVLHEKLDGSAGATSAVINELNKRNIEYDAIVLHWSDIYVPMLPKMLVGITAEDTELMDSILRVNVATRRCSSVKHKYLNQFEGIIQSRDDVAASATLAGIYTFADVSPYSVFGVYAMSYNVANNSFVPSFEASVLASPDVCDIFNAMYMHDKIELCYCVFDQWKEPNMQIEIYGDSDSYLECCNLHAKEKEVRYFNQMTYTDDTCTKTSLNARGHKLLANELRWYDFVKQTPVKSVPTILKSSEHSFTMTRINGVTVKEYIDTFDPTNTCTALAIGLLDMFKQQIEKPLHEIVSYSDNIIKHVSNDVKLEAMLKEYVSTNTSRYYEVNTLLDNIVSYNGTKLATFEQLMHRLTIYLNATVENTEFAFLHGDPHTGNVMIDNSGTKLFAIDPRGYFGEGKYNRVGDADYDIAKFAFGLNGNTNFARSAYHRFEATKDDFGNVHVQANVVGYDLDLLPLTTRQKLLVALCWIKFPAWLKNNPVEAIITYAYGSMLTNRYLTELGY